MPSGDDMDSAQEVSNDKELATEVMESLGEPTEAVSEMNESEDAQRGESKDPLYVQKRLKQQSRKHEREIRAMQQRLDEALAAQHNSNDRYGNANPYEESGHTGNVDEQIHKAVSYALQAKEREERAAKEAEARAHVQKQYQALHGHLDKMSDKYDDFDEVVRGQDTPFTEHMRDAALFLDMDSNNPGSAGEVLYKLAKNPEELNRISKLHPLEQAREIVKLSKALISSGEPKASNNAKPLGQVKNSPVNNSHAVNEKTPISSIRQRMKQGSWR